MTPGLSIRLLVCWSLVSGFSPVLAHGFWHNRRVGPRLRFTQTAASIADRACIVKSIVCVRELEESERLPRSGEDPHGV